MIGKANRGYRRVSESAVARGEKRGNLVSRDRWHRSVSAITSGARFLSAEGQLAFPGFAAPTVDQLERPVGQCLRHGHRKMACRRSVPKQERKIPVAPPINGEYSLWFQSRFDPQDRPMASPQRGAVKFQ